MSESLEERLDHDVIRTLKFDTLVTVEHQRRARERLLAAAAQTMFETELEEEVSFSQHLHTFRQHTRRVLSLLLTDASIYERARHPRCPRQYYDRYGRYAFGMIYMSA